MHSGSEFDVIIAGGGLVGATLGIALKRAGLQALIVEASTQDDTLDLGFDGRASAIAYGPWRMLETLGIADLIETKAAITAMVVTDGPRDQTALGLHFDSQESAEGIGEHRAMGMMVENRHLRAALAKRLAKMPSVHTLAGTEVLRFHSDVAGIEVQTNNGHRYRAKLLVAADGKNSSVRQQSGIRTYGWPYGQSAIVTTVQFEQEHGGVAHEMFLPEGPIALLPLTERRANVVWSQSSGRARALMALSDQAFDAALSTRIGGFLGCVSRVGQRFSYPMTLEVAAQWVKPRLALVGDSAHTIHPVAGQGLNLGLKDVAALAHVLGEANALGQDIGDLAVLERYERWRRFDTMTMAAGTDAFIRVFSTSIAPLRALGRMGLALADRVGVARRFFMAEAGGANGDLPELLRDTRAA